jgi:hypothetical protein
MRNLLLPVVFSLIFFAGIAAAQIPNPGFENWTNGEPDGWVTSNVAPVAVTVTQATLAHSGTSSAKGTVISLGIANLGPVIANGAGGHGSTISQRYATFSGWYQFTGAGGDMFGINVIFGPVINDTGTAHGAEKLGPTTGWTQFTIPMTYYRPLPVDTAYIQFLCVGPVTGADVHVGSFFYIDDIEFSGTNDVKEASSTRPEQYNLEQNYPNPFNPSTNVRFSLPTEQTVTLKVFDGLGREVATVLDHKTTPAGTYEIPVNLGSHASGVYFYRLQAGGFAQTRAMSLVK